MPSPVSPRFAFAAAALLSCVRLTQAASIVPVAENSNLPVGARCPISNVFRLDPKGDGFLSIRTGPGAQYQEIGRLHNGDHVFVVQEKGSWLGIYYGTATAPCNAPGSGTLSRPRQGWVSRKYIEAD